MTKGVKIALHLQLNPHLHNREREECLFFTFSLIHDSSLSTFLLNSCRFLAPPRALVWFAAVCFRVCHWSLSWPSCFFTRSEVGFSLQINCSPIFWNRKSLFILGAAQMEPPDWHRTVAEYIWHLNFVRIIAYVPAGFTDVGKLPFISWIDPLVLSLPFLSRLSVRGG